MKNYRLQKKTCANCKYMCININYDTIHCNYLNKTGNSEYNWINDVSDCTEVDYDGICDCFEFKEHIEFIMI